MKKFYTLSFILLASLSFGQVTLPHYDGFDYPVSGVGTGLQTQTGWTFINTGDDIAIVANSLNYNGLAASTGNKISFSGSGIEAIKAIAPQAGGTLYYSLLLNVSTMAGVTDASGGYFAGFAQNTTTFGGTLWAKRVDDSSYNIGVEVRTANLANTTYHTTPLVAGQTYFIVVSYTFNTGGAADDEVKLWVNPVPGAAEPAATIKDVHTGVDLNLATTANFFFRQDSPAETGALEIDELRIGTTWADVTSPVLSLKQNTIAGLSVYPNPVKDGNLYITSNSSVAKTVAVYDILGKQVLEAKTSNNAVNVSNLKGGAYIVRITEDGNTDTRKLIIE
jgi:Secretion system C-terminal sorting domain